MRSSTIYNNLVGCRETATCLCAEKQKPVHRIAARALAPPYVRVLHTARRPVLVAQHTAHTRARGYRYFTRYRCARECDERVRAPQCAGSQVHGCGYASVADASVVLPCVPVPVPVPVVPVSIRWRGRGAGWRVNDGRVCSQDGSGRGQNLRHYGTGRQPSCTTFLLCRRPCGVCNVVLSGSHTNLGLGVGPPILRPITASYT